MYEMNQNISSITGPLLSFSQQPLPVAMAGLQSPEAFQSAIPGADALTPTNEASFLMQNLSGGYDQMMGLQGPLTTMLNDYNSLMQFAMPFIMASRLQLMNCLLALCNRNNNNNNNANNLNINNNDNNVIDNNEKENDGNVNLQPNGGWGGTQGPVQQLAALAGKGFEVISAKRDRQYTTTGSVSDHWIGNKNAYANDIGWGSSRPTQASDEAASRIVAALGGPSNWGEKGGVFNKTINGIRYQVIYKSMVGGNHYNHIHLGAKVA